MTRALLAFLLLPTLVLGYTSPGNPRGFINDFAGILSPDTVSTLEARLDQFSKETGNEISVVTIPTLGDESIETYAEKLFQEWGIGKEEEDNGLLLLIAVEDREMRIEVGYGLEPVVTDISASRIIREILTPAFQADNYDTGVINAISSLEEDIRNGTTGDYVATEELPPFGDIFYIAVFLLLSLGGLLGRSKSWWGGGIIGAVVGVSVGIFLGFIYAGIIAIGVLTLVGLIFDFVVSKLHDKYKGPDGSPPWFLGGGRHGGGGFGGFGGGMSGGGGASGRW